MHLELEWEESRRCRKKGTEVSLSLDTYDMDTLTTAQIILKTNATPEQRCDQEEETYQALSELPDTEVDTALLWAMEQSDSTMHWFVLPLIGKFYRDRVALLPLVRSCLLSDEPLVATSAISCLTEMRDQLKDTEGIIRELHNTLTSPWSKVIALGNLLLCHECDEAKAKLRELVQSNALVACSAQAYLSEL